MTDILIRGISAEAIARIEERAEQLGLSRNEYLRRQLDLVATADQDTSVMVTADDVRRASRAARDLDDPEVMSAAWR